jgi:microcystin-dependent protein
MAKTTFLTVDPAEGGKGTRVTADFLNWLQNQLVPTGAVFNFAASVAPVGFLECNGDTVPNGSGTIQGITADFAPLYAVLGSTFGAAGKLPDLRDDFVRGSNGTSRSVGTRESYATAAPRTTTPLPIDSSGNTISYMGPAANPSRVGFARITNAGEGLTSNGGAMDAIDSGKQLDLYNVVSGDAETRPRNVALLACIKY